MSFTSDVDAFVRKTEAKLLSVLRKAELDMLTDVVMMTPVDTGRARGAWQFTVGSPAAGEPGGTDRAGASTIARGAGAVANAQLGPDWFLTNNVPYILPLEFGHSKQAPNGMARIAAARFAQNLENAVRALGG